MGRDLSIINQNIDDLHERAGSPNVLHLHGNLATPKCFACNRLGDVSELGSAIPEEGALIDPPRCSRCSRCSGKLRSGVLWYGEDLPLGVWKSVLSLVKNCDVLLSIGTSGIVTAGADLPGVALSSGAVVIHVNTVNVGMGGPNELMLVGRATEILSQLYNVNVHQGLNDMTTVHERTSSLVETGEFLAQLSKDIALPDHIRSQAIRLLRHYPSAEDIRREGDLRRYDETKLIDSLVLPRCFLPRSRFGHWTHFFCEAKEDYSREGNGPTDRVSNSAETMEVAFTLGSAVWDVSSGRHRMIRSMSIPGYGCLTIEFCSEASRQKQALSYASKVFGSRESAIRWWSKSGLGLYKRPPCSLMSNRAGYVLVMDFLARLEYGVYQ